MALDPDMPAGSSRSTLQLGLWPELERALAAAVQGARAGDPLRPITIICGSGAARAYLRRRLVDVAGAHVAVHLVTIHELATRLGAPALTASSRRELTPAAASHLVRRVAAARGSGWYYGPVAGTPGFPSALARSLADLREAMVAPGFSRPTDSAGLRGIDEALAAYAARLEQAGLFDDALLYESAGERLGREGPGEALGDWVGVYGLYDLPGMQQRLFRAMAAVTPLHVFLPWSPAAGQVGAAHVFFAELCESVVEAATDGSETTPLDLATVRSALRAAPDRQREQPSAAGHSPAGATEGTSAARDGSVSFVSCLDPAGERREAARAVLAALHQGVPAVEVAVVHAQLEWRTLVAEQLEALGVPVAGRLARPSQGQRLLRALLDCLSPAAGAPFERAAVIGAAAAAACVPPPPGSPATPRLDVATVAAWDVLARETRVVAGLEQWRLRLASSLTAQGARRDGLARFVDSLAAAHEELQTAGSWSELASRLESRLAALAPLADDDPAIAAVRDLESLTALDEPCVWSDAVAVLREVCGGTAAATGRIGRDGVAVVSPHELRGLRFGVVVLAGLTEGVLPPRPRLDPILADDDRLLVRERTGARLELSTERPLEAGLLFTLASAAARSRLVLLHARTDGANGAPLLPSRLLLQAQAAFAGGPLLAAEADREGAADGLVRRAGPEGLPVDREQWSEHAWVSSAEFDWAAATTLASSGGRREARRYVDGVLAPSAARRRATLRSRHRSRLTRWDGLLPRPAAAALADELLGARLSASAVEAYLRCPFAFFIRYALHIRPLDEPDELFEPQPGDLGQLVHEALRRLYAGLAERDVLSREACAAALPSVLDEVVGEAERDGLIGFPLAWQARLRALHRDLSSTIADDPAWTDGLAPALFEWGFGEDADVAIEVGRRELRFHGRVDRLDRSPDGTVVRVVDYKTGKGTRERRRLERGLDVQLPVYRLAAAGLEPAPERVECVFRLVTRGGGLADVPLAADETASREALRQVLSVFVDGIAGGVFPRWREQRAPCDTCSFAYGCGTDRAAAERKRDDPRLAALRAFKEREA